MGEAYQPVVKSGTVIGSAIIIRAFLAVGI